MPYFYWVMDILRVLSTSYTLQVKHVPSPVNTASAFNFSLSFLNLISPVNSINGLFVMILLTNKCGLFHSITSSQLLNLNFVGPLSLN